MDPVKQLAEFLGLKLSKELDKYIFDCLKMRSPIAFWLLQKKIFQKKWLTKLLGFKLVRHPRNPDGSYEIDIYFLGGKIGTAMMEEVETIKK